MTFDPRRDHDINSDRDLWEKAQQQLKNKLSIFIWHGYVSQLSMRAETDNANAYTIRLIAPNAHISEYVSEHLYETIHQVFQSELGVEAGHIQLKIQHDEKSVSHQNHQSSVSHRQQARHIVNDQRSKTRPANRTSKREITSIWQSPRTQKTFKVLTKHIEAGAGGIFVLVGPSGTGKTHWLRTAHELYQKTHPTKKARFISGEQWVNDYIDSARNGRMNTFNHTWRQGYDALFLDDIDFFTEKYKSQENFQKLLDVLSRKKIPVYMSSSTAPTKLKKWDHRLRTRLSSALAGYLQPPTSAERAHFLATLGAELGLHAEQPIWDYLAVRVPACFSTMKGIAQHLKFFVDGQIVQQNIEEILPLFVDTSIHQRSPEALLDDISETTGVSKAHLVSASRLKHVVLARTIAAYLLTEVFHLSLAEVGRFLNRHPSSVHATLLRAESLLSEDISFQTTIAQIKSRHLPEEAPQTLLF